MRRPVAGQLYVYAVIALGAVVMATAFSSLQFSRPGLFAALLVLSVISSALKVDMPLGVGTSCISLSYAVDFTALLLLGPAPAMLIAVTSGWSQCTFRMGERNPAYKTLFSMATLAVSVAAAGAMYTAAWRHIRRVAGCAAAVIDGRGDGLLSCQLPGRRCSPSRCRRAVVCIASGTTTFSGPSAPMSSERSPLVSPWRCSTVQGSGRRRSPLFRCA